MVGDKGIMVILYGFILEMSIIIGIMSYTKLP